MVAILDGNDQFHNIRTKTKLHPKRIREALVVGIQHNFLYWFDVKGLVYYRVIENNILFRLRYPLCVRHILEKYSKIGTWIIQELLQQGRSTKSQLVMRVKDLLKTIKGLDYEETEEDSNIQKLISDLMHHQYITTVTHMVQEAMTKDQSSGKTSTKVETKLSSKFLASLQHDSKGQGALKRTRASSTFLPNKKKKVDVKAEGMAPHPPSSTPALEQALRSDEADKKKVEEDVEPLWCINPDRFNYEFRKELVLPFTINAESSEIVKACFNLFEQSWTYSDQMRDHPIKTKDIKAYLANNGIDIPSPKCKKYLDLLSRDTPYILKQIQDSQKTHYYVNVPSIMKLIQEITVDSIIKEKFGPQCLRIFRLILMKKHLEEQQISDLSMIPLVDTRNCLYTMLAGDFVQVQELQKGKKHNTSIFLWSIDLPHLLNHLLETTFSTIHNILKRIEHENNAHHILLLKEAEQQRRFNEGITQEILTVEEKKTLEKLVEVQKRLNNILIGLDKTVMVFTDKTAQEE
uniref:DNA-directed RNA polymerase III subunit RPC3 n=1 Tax=Arcella intermedia TaxID=1963864 RepID=A0A6B2L1P7_9EUKA